MMYSLTTSFLNKFYGINNSKAEVAVAKPKRTRATHAQVLERRARLVEILKEKIGFRMVSLNEFRQIVLDSGLYKKSGSLFGCASESAIPYEPFKFVERKITLRKVNEWCNGENYQRTVSHTEGYCLKPEYLQ